MLGDLISLGAKKEKKYIYIFLYNRKFSLSTLNFIFFLNMLRYCLWKQHKINPAKLVQGNCVAYTFNETKSTWASASKPIQACLDVISHFMFGSW